MKTIAPETRPLPVKWDGVPVEWSAWNSFRIFVCRNIKEDACSGCGLIAPKSTASGRREGKIVGQAFKTFQREIVQTLLAYRCTACGYTEVWDGEQLWELDDSDYTQFGSVAR